MNRQDPNLGQDSCSNEKYNQEEIKNFASWILSLTPLEFTNLATITGYIIAMSLTTIEQNSIGNWLEMVGQIILTFNSQAAAQVPPSPAQYCNLVKKVQQLENKLNELNKNNNTNY